MEGIDHVAVAERMQRKKILNAGVIGASGDEGIARRRLADSCSEARLNAGPAVRIVDLRLIQNLKEDALRVARGIVRRQSPPSLRPSRS